MPPFMADTTAPDDPVAEVLAAVANARQVIVSATALAGDLGTDPGTLWRLAGEAEALGWVTRWPDAPKGPCLALTPSSVAGLGLMASHDGSTWLRPGEPDPSVRLPRRARGGEEGDWLDEVACDSPSPLDDLVDEEGRGERLARSVEAIDRAREKPARRRSMAEYLADLNDGSLVAVNERDQTSDILRYDFDRDRFPRMRFTVGLGLVWPIAPDPDGSCGACHGRPLRGDACCLWCGRSGQDYRIRPVVPDQPKATARRGRPPKSAKAKAAPDLKGGIG